MASMPTAWHSFPQEERRIAARPFLLRILPLRLLRQFLQLLFQLFDFLDQLG